MNIAGEQENIPSWVADWPHCCHFERDTCDGLRQSAMLLEAQNRKKMTHFIALCGRALSLVVAGDEDDSGFPFYISLKVTAAFIRTIYTVYTLF